MATCENKIFQNIYSTCENKIVSGIEQRVWLFNRSEISYTTSKNEVTTLTLASGATGYLALGLKKNLTTGFERVQSDTAPDSWSNSLTFVGYEFDKLAMQNMDELGDIVAVVERKGVKSTDGTFLVMGLENGLYVNADSWSANDNGGARQITMGSLDEAGEAYSAYILTLSDQTKEGGSTKISTYDEIKEYLNSLVEE